MGLPEAPDLSDVDQERPAFTKAPSVNGFKRLRMQIYRPATLPHATVFFLHGGGFFTGAPNQIDHMVPELLDRGYSIAAPEYRLRGHRPVLSGPLAPHSAALAAEVPESFELPDTFGGTLAHCATEDALTGLTWVRKHGANHGLTPERILILGFSAGGIVALNLIFLLPALGIARPPIGAAVILSGALPNLARCDVNLGPPLYWAHGKRDVKVPSPSFFAMQDACEARPAATVFQRVRSKAHGTWLYRSGRGLPGADEPARRAPLWDFLDAHRGFAEAPTTPH